MSPALVAFPVMNRMKPCPLDRQRHRCDVKIPGERVLCVRPAVRCCDCGFGNPEGAGFCAHAERAGLRNALAAIEAALGPEGRATLASA